MQRAVLLATLVLAAPPARSAEPATGGDGLSEGERAFCAQELELLERRRNLFEAQGLSGKEIGRRNAPHLAELAECRERLEAKERGDREQRQDLEEVARRAGPNATELERGRAWREVRRERLGSKKPAALSPAERAELADGVQDEMATTHQALDDAHLRDPRFMRVVHSAIACYHDERRGELRDLISSEESLLKLGTGDRQRLYALRSELSLSEDVLSRNTEAARGLPGGLDGCTTPTVAVVTHCLAIRLAGTRAVPACDAEEIQQYVRFVK